MLEIGTLVKVTNPYPTHLNLKNAVGFVRESDFTDSVKIEMRDKSLHEFHLKELSVSYDYRDITTTQEMIRGLKVKGYDVQEIRENVFSVFELKYMTYQELVGEIELRDFYKTHITKLEAALFK